MSDYDDLVAALSPVSEALTKLGIRHYVGGSVASTFHGASRSTLDVDLVADISDRHVSEFLKCFEKDFYVSEVAVRDAIRRRSCFNLIHFPTSFKIDVFVSRQRPFDITAMNRARLNNSATTTFSGFTSRLLKTPSSANWSGTERPMKRPKGSGTM